MTASLAAGRVERPTAALFATTVFASATLVFLVQPMVAKLVLPLLGGSPSVWNTSLAFFQAALLAGYGYAHLLQRLPSVRAQALVHLLALIAAALVLPLSVRQPFGAPSVDHPILWLLGVLAVSVGAPFAVLSATAPLAQAWHARVLREAGGREPYVLYAASNLGSLLALVAYPIVVEPNLTLSGQRMGWSLGYGGFVLLIGALALVTIRIGAGSPAQRAAPAPPSSWSERLRWAALAAAPCSLMLGVTAHITTDVASAPFLWVVPLALYLATFVVAFAARPLIPPAVTLPLQAATAAASIVLIPFSTAPLPAQFAAHLSAFFFTALMCHQALVASRPPPERLTEFYFWMSLGGVLGGAFNAFLAPTLFNDVWEYPLVLTLSALARPQAREPVRAQSWVMLGLVVFAGLGAMVLTTFRGQVEGLHAVGEAELAQLGPIALLTAAAIAAVRLRGDGLFFCAALAALSIGSQAASERASALKSWRSFFGVLRITETYSPSMGGPVRMLSHGTTLHGAQAQSPQFRCRPLVYYTPGSPIGQVFRALAAERSGLRIGAVGLGAGSVATYVRPGDRMTFFEIDPLVVRVATDPRNFSYVSGCAKDAVDYVLGDARLTLAAQPAGVFDILLIDAFSSDAVPAHLLTVEAVRGYLTHLKPDGVLILHLSNRHLDLIGPAQAVASAAGGSALVQRRRTFGLSGGWEADEDAVIIGRSPEALARFAFDRRWRDADPKAARPWTDDYVNLPGALWRKLRP